VPSIRQSGGALNWHTTREAKCLQKLIPIDFDGTILLAGCWAHTRRAFYEALDHAPKEAGWILLQIGHLYEIERRLRRQRSGRALRDAYRSSQSRPICGRVRRMLQRWSIAKRFLPQSTMGKAIHYALEQWESLEVYLKDPLIEIDNNLVENAIRPTALGKKELAVLRRRQRRRTRCCDLLDH
jgi:transposase